VKIFEYFYQIFFLLICINTDNYSDIPLMYKINTMKGAHYIVRTKCFFILVFILV